VLRRNGEHHDIAGRGGGSVVHRFCLGRGADFLQRGDGGLRLLQRAGADHDAMSGPRPANGQAGTQVAGAAEDGDRFWLRGGAHEWCSWR